MFWYTVNMTFWWCSVCQGYSLFIVDLLWIWCLLFTVKCQLFHSCYNVYLLYVCKTYNYFYLTLEITFCSKVTDTQPQYGQFVELRDHTLLKRQQWRQVVEFTVKAFSVPLARVALWWVLGWSLHTAMTGKTHGKSSSKQKVKLCCIFIWVLHCSFRN